MEPDKKPTEASPPRRGRRAPGADPFPGPLRGRGCGPGHLKVDDLLRDEDRGAYCDFVRKPSTTHESARKWLTERGYAVGYTAVRNHAMQLRRRLAVVRQSAEMSYACAELARMTGTPVLADGAVSRFETLLSQALFDLEAGGKVDAAQWATLGRALTNAVNNRARVEDLRRAGEDARRAAAAAAETAAGGDPDGTTVVDRVKAILGV